MESEGTRKTIERNRESKGLKENNMKIRKENMIMRKVGGLE